MKNSWVLLVALFAGSVTCRSNRIVGGSDTTVEEFPSIVQLELYWHGDQIWQQECAGNILTARSILSAAHCLFGSADYQRVRAGATYRHIGGVVSSVLFYVNHHNFNTNGFEADIGMIRLRTPLVYSPVIQQTRIPPPDTVIPHDLPVTHAGWGATEQGGPPSEGLQHVGIYTIDNDLCRIRYASLPRPRPVTKNMICAGLLDVGGADACQGDSGGPLYYRDLLSGDILVGVVSWGHGCANETFPGVSIAVHPFFDWIISLVL